MKEFTNIYVKIMKHLNTNLEQNVEHIESAAWINEVKESASDRRKQEDTITDPVKVRQELGKPPKWKACGPDKVLEFWIQEFTNIYEKIIAHLNKPLENGKTPEGTTKGRASLILKDTKKGNETWNLWPITCLPIMCKVFTGILAGQVYGHMEREKLLLDEQKGCKRQSRGTKDQLMIDKMVKKELQKKNDRLECCLDRL